MYLIDKNLLPTPEVKSDPFSIDAVIAWLETKDGATAYDSYCHKSCFICRYASAVSGHAMTFSDAVEFIGKKTLGGQWGVIAYGHIWGQKNTSFDNTFAGALTRARAFRDGARP